MKQLKKSFIYSRTNKLDFVSPTWYIKPPGENEFYYSLDMRFCKLTWIEKELALLLKTSSVHHLTPQNSNDSLISKKEEENENTVLPDPNFILSADFSLNELSFLKYTDLVSFFELRQLTASFNKIVDMSGISACSRLTHLCLSYNNLKSLKKATLEQCKYLSHLDVRSNFISDLSDLPTLPSLRFLNLSYNHLKQLDGLQNLFALQELSLQHNQIDNILNLSACLELVDLNLAYNRLHDQVHVVNVLHHLNCLSTLNIHNNYFQEDVSVTLLNSSNLKFLDGKLVGEMESTIEVSNNIFSSSSEDLKSQLKVKGEKDFKTKRLMLETQHSEKLNYLYSKVLCLNEETDKELLESEENFAKWCIYVDNLSDKETVALVQKYLRNDAAAETPVSVQSRTFSGIKKKTRTSDPKDTPDLLKRVSEMLSKEE